MYCNIGNDGRDALTLLCTVVDPHHVHADPDPASQNNNVDPDRASQNNADPDPQLCYILWIQVFPRRTLAEILMKMMTSLPAGQLTEQKLDTLRLAPFTDLFSFSSPFLAGLNHLCSSLNSPDPLGSFVFFFIFLFFKEIGTGTFLFILCQIKRGNMVDR